ncbi:MAG: shikimate kinase, partial [Actinomycetota bacterium]
FRLLDTDAMIEETAGATIAELWESEGEEGFRAREHDAVLHACAGSGRVIACGGGAVLQIRNYGILKGAGTVVYLRAPVDVLRARVGDGAERPLLTDRPAFDRLLAERAPAYESAADLTVDTDGRTTEEVATAIVELLP